MSKQVINLGASANDGTGDPARSAFTKTNGNFNELYQYLGDGSNLNKLGTAAFKNVGTSAGNVMEVGAFGLGGVAQTITKNATPLGRLFKIFADSSSTSIPDYVVGIDIPWTIGSEGWQLYCGTANALDVGFRKFFQSSWGPSYRFRHTGNTTVDSNGFIKAASPIIQLYAEKIEPNEEALEQEPVFEKVDIGHYLLKNTEGFSDDGWYIEMPKDANGNVLVAVQYQQLEDNTIEVKTYAKKFDEETGDIVPNLEKPRDIPTGRWIDIRLKALPQPEIEISSTPSEFQPTNLAQAVAEALKYDAEQ
ncbi:hypothetical protein [Acinetobacter bereziniae]|uniref:phage tail fiber protein n=1 Tax=Acinetobacter bereziniae TaxID=106648 RepID=UPI0030170529